MEKITQKLLNQVAKVIKPGCTGVFAERAISCFMVRLQQLLNLVARRKLLNLVARQKLLNQVAKVSKPVFTTKVIKPGCKSY